MLKTFSTGSIRGWSINRLFGHNYTHEQQPKMAKNQKCCNCSTVVTDTVDVVVVFVVAAVVAVVVSIKIT